MAGKQKISYFYDPDVGNFYYGQVRDNTSHRRASKTHAHAN